MALKGQQTASDYIEWYKLQSLTNKLEKDGDWKFALLIAIGMYSGLRISDILSLRWCDLINNREFIEIIEKKTKKFRRIRINQNLSAIVNRIAANNEIAKGELIFLNRFHASTISTQFINRKLKAIAIEHNLSSQPLNIKSHSLRKSFGRRVFETNNCSEKSLVLLSEMFNHTSLATTRLYLGLRAQEIADVYASL